MADVHQRVDELENEVKVLKNEIKAILLDIREQYLNTENPFMGGGQVTSGGPVISIGSLGGQSHESSFSAPSYDEAHPAIDPNPPEETNNDSIIDLLEQETEEPDESTIKTKVPDKKSGTLPELSEEPDKEEESSPKKEKQGRKGGTLPELSQDPNSQGEDDKSPPRAERHNRKDAPWKGEKQEIWPKGDNGNNSGISMITIAGLSKWVDESTDKIGKERTEVMVEACHMVGHISPELKELLIKLVRLAQADEPKKGRVNTKDYLGVIAQLDGLLGYSNESEAALLTILTDSKESHG